MQFYSSKMQTKEESTNQRKEEEKMQFYSSKIQTKENLLLPLVGSSRLLLPSSSFSSSFSFPFVGMDLSRAESDAAAQTN